MENRFSKFLDKKRFDFIATVTVETIVYNYKVH